MQYRLGILIIGLHHIVYIVFHGIGASAFVKNYIHICTIEFIALYRLKEIILVHIIDELQATQVPIGLIFLFTVIQIIHNKNITAPLSI